MTSRPGKPAGGSRVVDFGIRGLDLMSVLIDTTRRDEPHGTRYVIQPGGADTDLAFAGVDLHNVVPCRGEGVDDWTDSQRRQWQCHFPAMEAR